MQVEISDSNRKKIERYRKLSVSIIPTYKQSDTGIVDNLLSNSLDKAIETLEEHLDENPTKK